jgi:hypothetical protein
MTPTVFLDEAPGVVVGEVQPETARPSMRPPLLFRCTACAGLLLAADFFANSQRICLLDAYFLASTASISTVASTVAATVTTRRKP